MVDFTKRAARAAEGMLAPGEAVLAASNVFPSPFAVADSATTAGAVAGGLVGGLVGAAVDRRRESRGREEDASAPVPAMANRPRDERAVPANGALLAVTGTRIVVWSISGLGKPRDVLFQIPLDTLDAVAWQEADPKWVRGKPRSTLFWLGIGGSAVLPVAAISMGPAGTYVRAIVDALAGLLPGKVREFTA
ncbi:MAG: hypothetical protein KQH83_08320 [Actinobacteria bacterium]|nr:hypothetical protein [Actinomycetota bacterium]